MAQTPAVVIIARHGLRLDAADDSWHLSTPTPYDPPLTYGGFNQCRGLGGRIASLLYAREQASEEHTKIDGVTAHDFALRGDSPRAAEQPSGRRKKKHKVVIHSSPFLRCVQTSVAIAAGMAQFQPPNEVGSRPTTARTRTHNALHSASPRLRALDAKGSPNLAPISEPEDFAHAMARRVLAEHKRYRRCKLRVDASLGEWLNPQYFDHITPPPPSALMLAAAKAELMRHESVDIFAPAIATKPSQSSLWGGSSSKGGHSKDSMSEDWEDVSELHPPSPSRRDRTSSMSSLGSNDSASGRRSPFRPGNAPVQSHLISTIPKPETSVYIPPTPHYAISASDHIPRGYVAHARTSCVNVDYQWDSSRPPQDWGDGGEYGEEWSAMHKRFRRALNHLVGWYGQHSVDDRAEDALGFDQAGHEQGGSDAGEAEEEDLVVVLVTHGAGCNALIGALTGQPVLLDVGMGSLTVATRRDDAPAVHSAMSGGTASDGVKGEAGRRESLDVGLSSLYEMKIIASSEHLRPGSDGRRTNSSPSRTGEQRSGLSTSRSGFASPSLADSGLTTNWSFGESIRSRAGTSSMLGSVRRPSAINTATTASFDEPATASGALGRSNTTSEWSRADTASPGLWSPVTNGMPKASAIAAVATEGPKGDVLPEAESAEEVHPIIGEQKRQAVRAASSTSRNNAMSSALSGYLDGASDNLARGPAANTIQNDMAHTTNGTNSTNAALPAQTTPKPAPLIKPEQNHRGSLSNMGDVPSQIPQALGRTLSQKGLWGERPAGDRVARRFGEGPKRRWTVVGDD
ncbi:hypothetical protein LTR62_001595 [Meristemomyces frigidus]|uniref:Phosphoglycerate mutase n=1 Tax=Meristemomyces frigidus TaxID=1508187 RepID=A0AAN7YBJ9_9PEZI|nr:hypothetical protein LTR62_001595 [Meristemomyces frigidus]